MSLLLNSRANVDALRQLNITIASEESIALVGAGLSIPSGLPSWNMLLNTMESKLSGAINNQYKNALRKEQDLLWRAEEYRRLLDPKTYRELLGKIFQPMMPLARSDPAVTLIKLPFRHFMTTNYDNILENAHQIANRPLPRTLNWSRGDDVRQFIFGLRDKTLPRMILHLHGHFSDLDSIVLSDTDYTERYIRTFDTTRKLFAIFTTERIVFVGFSLNDPDLMALLREVNASLRSDEPRHFAIMGLGPATNEILERSRLRKRFGVEPVFYDNSKNNHKGLHKLLNQLKRTSSSVRITPPPLTLQRKFKSTGNKSQPTERDPEDPQKGKWGGEAKSNDRVVSATVKELEPDWFKARIIVKSTNPHKPLIGKVRFHLHPTIIPPVREASAKKGVAQITVESYGAYTVGIEADGGKTKLELDLADLEDAPELFRLN